MSEVENTHPASGIEALIDKLRAQGVQKGQDEAARILKDAEAEASLLINQAQEEAEQLVAKAQKEAEQLKRSGEEALKMAARNLLLDVKESLAHSFTDQVDRLVRQQMDNDAFLQRLVLELVGQVREQAELDDAGQVEVLLPETFIGIDELRRNASEYSQGRLSQLVQSLSAQLLREGVTFNGHGGQGIKVQLVGQDVEIDLTDQAVSRLLLRHLQPRFRALLEGVIR